MEGKDWFNRNALISIANKLSLLEQPGEYNLTSPPTPNKSAQGKELKAYKEREGKKGKKKEEKRGKKEKRKKIKGKGLKKGSKT